MVACGRLRAGAVPLRSTGEAGSRRRRPGGAAASLASERLVKPALGRALQDAGDLGEQVRAPRPAGPGADERRSQARKALTYMARQFGSLDAADDMF